MKPAHGDYRPDIDGLRAFAVGAVVLYHAFNRIPGGFIGVDVFFVISGYLITGIISRRLDDGNFSVAGFYRARIRRIFPALITVLAAVLVAGWFLLLTGDYRSLGRHTAGGAFFIANLLLWQDVSYFDPEAATKPLLHLWSLGIEEQFYLAWPVLMMVVGRRHLRGLAWVIAAASFGLSVWLTAHDPTAAYYSPFSRAFELMAGALMALYRPQLPQAARQIAPAIGLAAMTAACFAFAWDTPFPGYWALLPVAATAMVIAAGPDAWVNRTILSWRPFVWLGLVSYPLYLWHWPLLAFPFIRNLGEDPSSVERAGLVLLALLLAILTYRLIERPSRRLVSIAQLIALMVLIGGAGVVVSVSGFPARAANDDPRRQFAEHYAELHRHGLARAYSAECDFYDLDTRGRRAVIAPSCTPAGARYFIWGDSHAQSLSYGIRQLAAGPVAQVTTSGCRPLLGPIGAPTPAQACDGSNAYARAMIARLRPDTVILAQRYHHEQTEWRGIAAWLRAQGVRRVVLIGPLPEWKPSLPAIVANHFWGKDHRRIAMGLQSDIAATSARLERQYAGARDLIYVPLIPQLCDRSGCIAELAGGALIAADYGHLTAEGSVYVAGHILRPALNPSATANEARAKRSH